MSHWSLIDGKFLSKLNGHSAVAAVFIGIGLVATGAGSPHFCGQGDRLVVLDETAREIGVPMFALGLALLITNVYVVLFPGPSKRRLTKLQELHREGRISDLDLAELRWRILRIAAPAARARHHFDLFIDWLESDESKDLRGGVAASKAKRAIANYINTGLK